MDNEVSYDYSTMHKVELEIPRELIRKRANIILSDELFSWLQENAPVWEWEVVEEMNKPDRPVFYFEDPQIALMFKLAWGGKIEDTFRDFRESIDWLQ